MTERTPELEAIADVFLKRGWWYTYDADLVAVLPENQRHLIAEWGGRAGAALRVARAAFGGFPMLTNNEDRGIGARGLERIAHMVRTVSRSIADDPLVRAGALLVNDGIHIHPDMPKPLLRWVEIIDQCLEEAVEDGDIPAVEVEATGISALYGDGRSTRERAVVLVSAYSGIKDACVRFGEAELLPLRAEQFLLGTFRSLQIPEERAAALMMQADHA